MFYFLHMGPSPKGKSVSTLLRTCRKMEVRIETKTGNIFLELSAFSKQTNKGPIFFFFFLNSISQTSKESQTQILTKRFKEGPGLVLR